ncbi:MAG: indole-3-glycerol phosphate synthase TrpC [Alphaproteobacteria bacterium]
MTILDEICAKKRKHVEHCKQLTPESTLIRQSKAAPEIRSFIAALTHRIHHGRIGLIAEIKKASPSAGVIRPEFDVIDIAKAYQAGGAACLSVLTDEPYFEGHDDYLMMAKKATKLPVLRKDFIVDPYQVVESRVLGADCILLIMAIVSDRQAAEIISTARTLGMDTLVEVHNAKEMQRALHLGPDMIGINNRNLDTLEVDLGNAERLAGDIPDSCLAVCESGIHTHSDLQRMKKSGISAFLVGESLMRNKDITHATKTLLGQ